jgi:hypothetical protein
MFGAVIIHPPDLALVQREFLVAQSELYLGSQRQRGDYAKMLRGQPDAVGAAADATPLTSAQPAQPAGRAEQLPGAPGAEEHHPGGEVQREPAAAE